MYIHCMPQSFVRKQIYLTREQDRRLKTLAGRRRRPAADLVREALDRYLGLRRPKARLTGDPLWDIVGCARSQGGVPVEDQDRTVYAP